MCVYLDEAAGPQWLQGGRRQGSEAMGPRFQPEPVSFADFPSLQLKPGRQPYLLSQNYL